MKLLITGVTGFLGGEVALAAAAAGHQVKGLVRDPGRWTRRPRNAEHVVGDVTDPETVREAVRGADAVIHAAALVKMWARDPRSFDRVNVAGLKTVVGQASACGVRVIYTSSFVALGPTDGGVFDENSPRAAIPFHNDYERSKTEADRLATRLVEQGADLVRLYPGVVFGPGALTAGNHVVRLLLQHAGGKLPGMLGRGLERQCFAYVGDVAAGFLAALERARAGDRFILGGENRTAAELFETFHSVSGIAPPRRRIPFWLAAGIGRLQRLRADLFGVEPELTDEVVGIYRHEWAYSSARAERALGYRITPFSEALARTYQWLRGEGHLIDSGARPR